MTRASKRKKTKSSSQVILFSVMRYDDPGQLTVPNHLNLGNDGKFYLTRSSEVGTTKAKPQPISLKESVAWFRLGHDYSLNATKGDRFSEWLKMIEETVS
jgi:hypothetical protein